MHFVRSLFACALALASSLALQASALLVDDTFSDGNSRNQNLAAHSLNVFDGRTGPAGTSGGMNFTRTDEPGALRLNLNTSTSSQAAWAFFTGSQATTSGVPSVSTGPWTGVSTISLQVGDTLTFVEKFRVTGLKGGQDIRMGLFDSGGTRTTANTTGGQNDSSFADDLGYGLDFFLSGNSVPFTVGKRNLALASSLGSLNNLFLNFGAFPPLPAAGGATSPPLQPLANGVVYTLMMKIYRQDVSTNLITVSVTGGSLVDPYRWQVIDASSPVTTFDSLTAARFNGAGFADSITFSEFSVVYTPAMPVITAHPTFSSGATSQTVGIGGQVLMSVSATGSELTYQWRKDGNALPNLTGPTAALSNLQLSDTGSYDVIVTNGGGSVTSNPLQLTVTDRPVNPPPIIQVQPDSRAVNNGSDVTFAISAAGTDLTYQWFKDDSPIPGAVSRLLLLPHVQASDAGSYHVLVANDGGSLFSRHATLSVLSPNLVVTSLYPAPGATAISPDSPLRLTFPSTPAFGSIGTIKIYDAANDSVVDIINVSSPSQRGNPSYLSDTPYQTKTIGGLSGFNYYPAIISGYTVTLYPRNGALGYNKTYYLKIDSGFFRDSLGNYAGISSPAHWRFTTKSSPPPFGSTFLTVAADGSGDFATVQGAVDFVPAGNTRPTTLFIRSGTYTEIVYFGGKNGLTFLGEDRQETVLTYPNNNTFNNAAGVYHRSVFYGNNVANTVVAHLTIKNATPQNGSQAESLILTGSPATAHNLLTQVNLLSFQDTLQLNGQSYVSASYIEGDVDFVWGNGPSFFENCELKILRSGGYFTQVRNDATRHGFVFLQCRLTAPPGVTGAYLARIDPNPGLFPFSEVVWLNTTIESLLAPAGWLLNNASAASEVHFWEYNSRSSGGVSLDLSTRAPFSRQLTLPTDAQTISDYSRPSFVLSGWVPQLVPVIVKLPSDRVVPVGQSTTLSVEAIAVPEASFQWYKDDLPLPGATSADYELAPVSAHDAGNYSVVIMNRAGSVRSSPVRLSTSSAFTEFITRSGLNPATTGAIDADPESDGVPNGMEFLLGGDPSRPDPAILPKPTYATQPNGPFLIYQFEQKPVALSALSWSVEYSLDLKTWVEAVDGQDGVRIIVSRLDPATERVTVSIPGASPRLFARLRVREL